MDKGTTKRLEEVLLNLDNQKDLEKYVEENGNIIEFTSFSEFINKYILDNKIDISEMIKRSGIDRTYGYQIINGTRNNPGRDKVIRICIASQMTVKDLNRALEISKVGPLYSRDKRDAIIVFAVNNNLDVENTNLLLDAYNCASLA